ncbi:unnamed protein product [Closterium sp. Yama58-4]|nr:unnamed protein product [Closterium sp. Yama58-4]
MRVRAMAVARAAVVALVVARCCIPLARAAPVLDTDMGVVAELAVAWNRTAACKTWVRGRDCDTMAGLLCDAQGHAVAMVWYGGVWYGGVWCSMQCNAGWELVVVCEGVSNACGLARQVRTLFHCAHPTAHVPSPLNVPQLNSLLCYPNATSVRLLSPACTSPACVYVCAGASHPAPSRKAFHLPSSPCPSSSTCEASAAPSSLCRPALHFALLSISPCSPFRPALHFALPSILNLTGCRISVSLSSFISRNISSPLETLILAGNFFSDYNMTDDLGRITSLRHLDLSYNSLWGPLPDGFSALQHLTALHINANGLDGLPTVLTTLTALKHLSMGANGFEPAIPPLLGDIGNLQMLSCVYCFVNGPLPSALSRLKKLTEFTRSIAHSRIRGSIPQAIGQLVNLTHLGLYYTGVWGTLPSSLGNLINLENLYLPRNNLSWTIPNSFSRLRRLSTLELSENRLSGPIPSILGLLTNLDRMTLHGNRLAGIIPASLGRLSRLTFMDLSSNRIRGTIPAALSGLSSIDDLDLGGNRLSGTIPAAFSALSSLKNLNLQSNQLVGSLPSLQLMKSVRNVFASSNFLTGTTDASLANIQRLCKGVNLYLQYNCLGNTSVLCGTGQTQRSTSEGRACGGLGWRLVGPRIEMGYPVPLSRGRASVFGPSSRSHVRLRPFLSVLLAITTAAAIIVSIKIAITSVTAWRRLSRILPGLAPRLGGAALAPFPPHGARSIAATSLPMAAQGAPPAVDGEASYDYDLVVIGGGSGGLACSKEAAKLGKKVACLDFVKPTPTGTQWGLGGTCVNVGCIPKKLMHQAALLGESFSDARAFGWDLPRDVKFDWAKLVQGVGDHIGSLNWGYRVALRDAKVTYVNALGRFIDPHTLECTSRAGQVLRMTAERFVIAVGGRPRYLGVPGDKELCITSDDIFSLQRRRGRRCVWASYISLETAGFLAGLGFPVSVMPRSILLRGFDQEVAEHIGLYMERHGISFIRPAVPTRFDRTADGKVAVTYKRMDTGAEGREEFDTVVIAVGRDAQTQELNLAAAGVDVNPLTGKIIAPEEQTSAPHIYAIGDVLDTRQELTPVAIKAGQLLAHRLFAGSSQRMDYNLVPTTVFTPLEYGCIGMAEELAIATYGPDNIEVYHSYFKPLEWQVNHEESNGVSHREDNVCYAKLVCNKLDSDRVLGLHVVGPNAGEITQGYAVAMRMGACKADFDATVGIHPTMSEEFTSMPRRPTSFPGPLISPPCSLISPPPSLFSPTTPTPCFHLCLPSFPPLFSLISPSPLPRSPLSIPSFPPLLPLVPPLHPLISPSFPPLLPFLSPTSSPPFPHCFPSFPPLLPSFPPLLPLLSPTASPPFPHCFPPFLRCFPSFPPLLPLLSPTASPPFPPRASPPSPRFPHCLRSRCPSLTCPSLASPSHTSKAVSEIRHNFPSHPLSLPRLLPIPLLHPSISLSFPSFPPLLPLVPPRLPLVPPSPSPRSPSPSPRSPLSFPSFPPLLLLVPPSPSPRPPLSFTSFPPLLPLVPPSPSPHYPLSASPRSPPSSLFTPQLPLISSHHLPCSLSLPPQLPIFSPSASPRFSLSFPSFPSLLLLCLLSLRLRLAHSSPLTLLPLLFSMLPYHPPFSEFFTSSYALSPHLLALVRLHPLTLPPTRSSCTLVLSPPDFQIIFTRYLLCAAWSTVK